MIEELVGTAAMQLLDKVPQLTIADIPLMGGDFEIEDLLLSLLGLKE